MEGIMSSKRINERGDFLFTVREFGPPTMGLFIAAEPRSLITKFLGNSAQLAFDIKTKDPDKAQLIADFLNENIATLSFTYFDGHPMYDASTSRE
jgi:hypothetical protein